MEKLRFAIKFVVLLAALPVIMFTELTRKDKVPSQPLHNQVEKTSVAADAQAVANHSSFLQAVNN
ncbi:MAG TPA: hypothetical protein VGC95_13080 [Chitinophagaceae bacterium]